MLSTCSCFDSCIAHVEHAGQDPVAAEVGEAEEVNQEEEQQQFVGADQEPESEQDLTNFYNTQGKHRCMINLVPFTTEFYNYYYLRIKFIGVV